MSSEEKNDGDLNSAIQCMRWDEVRRIIRSKRQRINEIYLGVPSLHTIVLARAPQNLLFEILEFAEKVVIDDVNSEVAGRSVIYHLASYGYVDALRRALGISQKRVNWKTECGDTPLHALLQGNHSFHIHLHTTHVLLDVGADCKMKNQNGLTPIDMYVQNKCEAYDLTNVKKQREEILQLLYRVAVPGVILERGKEALNVFNKDLEKGQITVIQAQLIATGGLEGILQPLMLDITKMVEEEATADGVVYTTNFEDYCSDCKAKEGIDEHDGIKLKSENELKANVAKKRKETEHATTSEQIETEHSRLLLESGNPMKVRGSCDSTAYTQHATTSEQIETEHSRLLLESGNPMKVRDGSKEIPSNVAKNVNGLGTEAVPPAALSSLFRRVSPRSPKRNISSTASVETEHATTSEQIETEHSRLLLESGNPMKVRDGSKEILSNVAKNVNGLGTEAVPPAALSSLFRRVSPRSPKRNISSTASVETEHATTSEQIETEHSRLLLESGNPMKVRDGSKEIPSNVAKNVNGLGTEAVPPAALSSLFRRVSPRSPKRNISSTASVETEHATTSEQIETEHSRLLLESGNPMKVRDGSKEIPSNVAKKPKVNGLGTETVHPAAVSSFFRRVSPRSPKRNISSTASVETEHATTLKPTETEHRGLLEFEKSVKLRERSKDIHSNVAKKQKKNGRDTVPPGPATVFAQMSTAVSVHKAKSVLGVSPPSPMRKSHSTASTSVSDETEVAEVMKTSGEEHNTGVIANEDITYIWDFPGQFYSNHPVFLKSEAVYLIEFNLMENMQGKKKKCRVSRMEKDTMTNEMTIIQIIKYRMELIFTYAVHVEQKQLNTKKPKIAVVGTHNEGTDEEKEQAEEQFRILFQEIKGTPYERYVVRKMYLLDNESPQKSEFQKTLKQDISGFLKAMPNTIPLKWYKFQRILQEMGRKAMQLHYDEVCKVATQCGILEENLIHTLNYLHDLGIVMYFQQNRLLRDRVVINPWKVNNITEKLITAVNVDDKMVQLWDKLDNEGILEEKLIEHILEEELSKDEIGVFVELMKQVGLMCEQTQKDAPRSFYIPCRSKYSSEKMTITPDNDQTVSIYMTSDDFLFDSTYHRLVVRLIELVQAKGSTTAPKLFYNKAIIDFGRDHTLCLGQVIDNKPTVKLEISRKSEIFEDGKPADAGTGKPSPNVCTQVFEHLKKELKALTFGMKHTSYMFRVLCWSDLQYHFHNMEECLKNECIRCGGKDLETSKLHKLFKNLTDGNQVYLEDHDLHRISRALGSQWKLLGVTLGLSWNRINQIWRNCYEQQPDCTFEMLNEWRKQHEREPNQVKIMVKALIDEKRDDLANSLLKSQRHVTSCENSTVQTSHRPHHDGYLADIDKLSPKNLIAIGEHLAHILA